MVGAAEHASLDSSSLFGEGDDCRCQGCGSQECSDGDGLDRSLPPRKQVSKERSQKVPAL